MSGTKQLQLSHDHSTLNTKTAVRVP